MIPWCWLIITAMLAGSAGALLMAIIAAGARADRLPTTPRPKEWN